MLLKKMHKMTTVQIELESAAGRSRMITEVKSLELNQFSDG